ncbi:hypothetical protein CAP35_15295 [Chitinophagaceae bacterium IBVUCB1]|nr:hypothetical protein CAP35_15295 [Chitinophagaceae bacterium IBVUCB1]
MKKALLFIIALCTTKAAYTAEGPQGLTTGVVIGGGGFPHFDPTFGNEKPGSVNNYRVVAKVALKFSNGVFIPSDSVRYAYSGGRSGLINIDRPNYDELFLFDDAVTYYYNNSSAIYDNKLFRKQTFDAENKITSLRYAIWHLPTQAWKDSARYLYKYMAGTKKIEESLFQLWVGGTWSHNVPSTLSYVGNNVVSISSNAYSATYMYDANNNIISITDQISQHGTGNLYNNERKTYTYNTDNEVDSYTLEQWDNINSRWVFIRKFEYTYYQKNIDESLEYYWDAGSWKLYGKHTYAYNSLNKKTSEILQLWTGNAYINHTFETCTYNAADLIESITIRSWNNATASWALQSGNTQMRFYYEYFAPTSIAYAQHDAFGMQLYPVPATNVLNINLNQQQTSPVMFTIRSMSGAVIRQWQQSGSQLQATVQLDGIASGNYTVVANTASGQSMVRQFSISK